MPRFTPSVRRAMMNFQLRMDVEDLHGAYRAALTGLRHRESEIEAFVRGGLGIGPDDPWPEADDTGSDDPIALMYEMAGEMDAQTKRGVSMVREAFLIALFHVWERYCNRRLNTKKYDYRRVEDLLIADGFEKSVEIVDILQLTANCAKHSAGNSCSLLSAKRPSSFPRLSVGKAPSHTTLAIGADELDGFFNEVLAIAG